MKDFCKDKNNKKLTMCKKGEYYDLYKMIDFDLVEKQRNIYTLHYLQYHFFPGRHRKRSITSNNDGAWERRKRDGKRDRVYLWIDRIVPYEIDGQLGKRSCLKCHIIKEVINLDHTNYI